MILQVVNNIQELRPPAFAAISGLLRFRGGSGYHLDPSNAVMSLSHKQLVGGFKYFLFSSLFGEDSHFDYCNIFEMGWFNHQLDNVHTLSQWLK